MDSLDDNAPLQNRDGKLLRGVFFFQVWADSRATRELLSRKFNGENSALRGKLNYSFSAIDQGLDSIPTISMLQQQ